jgi:hypothetical protein
MKSMVYVYGVDLFPEYACELSCTEQHLSDPYYVEHYPEAVQRAYMDCVSTCRTGPAGCPWNDYDELKELMPVIKRAAQRWNRFSLADIVNFPSILNDSCRVSVLSSSPVSCPSTGLSDDAFAAIIAARLHEEGRLEFWNAYNIGQDLADLAYRFFGRNSTLGIANLDPRAGEVVDQLVSGHLPPGFETLGAFRYGAFDSSRLSNVNGENYIAQYRSRQGDRGEMYDWLRKKEVAIELVAANMYRGILVSKASTGSNDQISGTSALYVESLGALRTFLLSFYFDLHKSRKSRKTGQSALYVEL